MQVPTTISSMLKGMTAASHCLRIISRVPEIDPMSSSGVVPTICEGRVEVRDVTFAYPSSPDCLVCDGFSLVVPAGSSCALCGPSGSGKSTIIMLLERFYDPQSGSVVLDGNDIRTLNLAWLRGRIGLVSQEPVLFEGSIAENIRYGKPDATQEEVEAAARMADAHKFIQSDLSGRYETQVGRGGGKLSGGQKQRVAIARGLIKQPSLLLLDEATSALDNNSERIVQAALDEITQTQSFTSLIIAHRLSTVRNADKIVVLQKGVVVEEGTYSELLEVGEGGAFHALAAKQEQDAQQDSKMLKLLRQYATAATCSGVSARTAQPIPSDHKKIASAVSPFASAASTFVSVVSDSQTVPPAMVDETAVAEPSNHQNSGLTRRLLAMYAPTDRLVLSLGCLGATVAGTVMGFMGIVMIKSTFPFRDTFDPDALERVVLFWGIFSLGLGVLLHFVDTGYKICFGLTGERLTKQLRVMALHKLLHQDIGFFDEQGNSVGELSSFLAEKLSLIQGFAQDGLMQIFYVLSTLIASIIIAAVLGDYRILLIYMGGIPISFSALLIGQVPHCCPNAKFLFCCLHGLALHPHIICYQFLELSTTHVH